MAESRRSGPVWVISPYLFSDQSANPKKALRLYLVNLNAVSHAFLSSTFHDLVLMGDFNLHIESSLSDVRQLTSILESFDLNQRVNFPTQIYGHSLDVMIFSKGCDVLYVSPSDAISDHFSVIADLKIPTDHSHAVPQSITYHKLKVINMEAFKADIKNSDLIKNPKSNATELAQQYDSVLSTH